MELASCYPNTEIKDETVVMYVRLLKDIPPEELQIVADQVLASSKFFPTIAEIRDAWHALNHADQLTWADGWNAVQKEIRRIGSYGIPKFDDPITAKVVETMGWKTMCAALIENIATDRAQFRQMYEGYASRQERNEKLLPEARQLAERLSMTEPRNGGLITMRDLLEGKVQRG